MIIKKLILPGVAPIYRERTYCKISFVDSLFPFSPKIEARYANLGGGFKKQASYQAYRLLPLPDVALNNQAGAH